MRKNLSRPHRDTAFLIIAFLITAVVLAPAAQPQSISLQGTGPGATDTIFPDGGDLNSPYRRLPVYSRIPYFYGAYADRYRRYYVQADWYQPTPWHAGPYLYRDKSSTRNAPDRHAATRQQTPVEHPLLRGLTLSPEAYKAARITIGKHHRAQSQAKSQRQNLIRETWAHAKAAKADGDLDTYKLHLQTLRELSEKPTVTQPLIDDLRLLVPEDQHEAFEQNVSAALAPAPAPGNKGSGTILAPESGEQVPEKASPSESVENAPSTDAPASETPPTQEP